MEKSFENLASGSVRAFNHLVSAVSQFSGLNEDDAVKVARFYRKNKFVKFDAIHGTSHVKHGQFLDRDVLLRALDMAA